MQVSGKQNAIYRRFNPARKLGVCDDDVTIRTLKKGVSNNPQSRIHQS